MGFSVMEKAPCSAQTQARWGYRWVRTKTRARKVKAEVRS
jgi:hypothetical protein